MIMNRRLTWDEYFMEIAFQTAMRGTVPAGWLEQWS